MDDELLKKAKSKHTKVILTVVVLALFGAAFFWGFKVMGPGKGSSGSGNGGSGSSKGKDGTVTVSIDCKSLAEDPSKLTKPELKKYIPEDGVILKETEYKFKEGEFYSIHPMIKRAKDVRREKDRFTRPRETQRNI